MTAAPDLGVVFLGTGARSPTRERGVAATLVARGAEHLLVDCGEGTTRQMLASTARLGGLTTILITHCHADHVLGLPGLLATFSGSRVAPLAVLGPVGTAALLEGFRAHFGELGFPLRVREAAAGESVDRGDYAIEAVAARHGAPALAWALRERPRPGHLDPARLARLGVPEGPERGRLAEGAGLALPGGRRLTRADVAGRPGRGRALVFSGDTRPSPAVARAAAGADLLVHEATFLERDRDLAARTGHSTAAAAARLARAAGVRMLALTHCSARYRPAEVEAEARAILPGAIVAADLDLIQVPLPERGPPRHVAGGGRAPGPLSPPG